MIKINLITVKRRKPIQIPFAAIFLVIALAGIASGFYFATLAIAGWNNHLIEKKKQLEEEIKRNRTKFEERDRLLSEKRTREMRIEQLKQLTGANLLQWSEVFALLTEVVPEKTVWLTNLRIDSDRRVTMSGYACEEEGKKSTGQISRGLQNFIMQLQDNGKFDEVFLNNANKNTYEKAPVWRFDITCRIKKEIR